MPTHPMTSSGYAPPMLPSSLWERKPFATLGRGHSILHVDWHMYHFCRQGNKTNNDYYPSYLNAPSATCFAVTGAAGVDYDFAGLVVDRALCREVRGEGIYPGRVLKRRRPERIFKTEWRDFGGLCLLVLHLLSFFIDFPYSHSSLAWSSESHTNAFNQYIQRNSSIKGNETVYQMASESEKVLCGF